MKPVRLQKFLSEAGVCSRRKAETLIEELRVTVDGQVAEIGQSIIPGKAVVQVDGQRVRLPQKQKITCAMNKPRRCVCTHSDPNADRTVFDLLPKELRQERLVCAGRLDKDSEGLLILTSDGDLAQRLTHPSRQIIKKYQVKVQRALESKDIPALLKGKSVEGQWLQFVKIILPKNSTNGSEQFEIHLDHGKKREIRRLLKEFGYLVKRLKRTQIGAYRMRGIPRGHVKVLRDSEIKLLLEGEKLS